MELRTQIDICIDCYVETGDVHYMYKAQELLAQVKQLKGQL